MFNFGKEKTPPNNEKPRERFSFKERLSSFGEFLDSLLDETFEEFLNSQEKYLDKLMIETGQKEHLVAMGGKMILSLPPDNSTGQKISEPNEIQITVDLYFQDQQKKWIKKTLKGTKDIDSLKDWDTDKNLEKLRKENTIEFSIDPPDTIK